MKIKQLVYKNQKIVKVMMKHYLFVHYVNQGIIEQYIKNVNQVSQKIVKNFKMKEYVVNVKINIIMKHVVHYIPQQQIVKHIQMNLFQHVKSVMMVIFYFNFRTNVNHFN